MSNLRISHESLNVDDIISDLNSAKNETQVQGMEPVVSEPDEVAV